MGKSLIITEKPSVAREFAGVLGVKGNGKGYIENDEYVITWCVGHLVGLVYPESYDLKYKKWRLEDLPFLPKEYKYDVIKDVSDQYDVVHHMLMREDIDRVYWAGDAGKEGQTIEENIRHFGGVRPGMEELRVWIDSQTKDEILRGLREAKPMSDYKRLGESGTMRTIEDYALGINFSRVMSIKYGRLLNDEAGTKKYTAIAVGRVMTCVLGMVVVREREIRSFKETPFYRVTGRFSLGGNSESLENTQESQMSISDLINPAAQAGGPLSDGTDSVSTVTAEWRAIDGSAYVGSPLLYSEDGADGANGAEKSNQDLSSDKNAGEKGAKQKKAPGGKYGFLKKEDAQSLIKKLSGRPARVLSVDRSTSKKKAPLLFNLAELQAECSKRFKISPDETLAAAQALYEKKLLTYPRTDARVLSSAIAKEISKNIAGLAPYEPTERFVAEIMGNKAYANIGRTQYTDDSKVTDHYAIIPTGQTGGIGSLPAIQKSVFDLVVRRFLSIFYPPAEYETLKLSIGVETEGGAVEPFFASAKTLKEPGYLKVAGMPKAKDKDEGGELLSLSGKVTKGSAARSAGFDVREGKTSPPKPYTSGSMVLAMENAGQLIEDEELRAQIKGSGIGTSATRADIIKKLVKIGYIRLNNKTQVLSPAPFGEMVYEVVRLTVPALLNPKMTASWEKGLDGITNGTVDVAEYRKKLEDFVGTKTRQVAEQDLRPQLKERFKYCPKGAPATQYGGGYRSSYGKGKSNTYQKKRRQT